MPELQIIGLTLFGWMAPPPYNKNKGNKMYTKTFTKFVIWLRYQSIVRVEVGLDLDLDLVLDIDFTFGVCPTEQSARCA